MDWSVCRGGCGGQHELGHVCCEGALESGAFDVKHLYAFSSQSVGAGEI